MTGTEQNSYQLTAQAALRSFFGVVADGRSYLNVLYNLLAFPLGIAYFIFLSVGWSLGLGTVIIWIGLFVLLAVLGLSWLFSAFERQQAIFLLGAEVEPMWPKAGEGADAGAQKSGWDRFKAFLGNKVTWTGMAFLLLKFPLGIASFVAAVTSLSISLSFLLMPFFYRWDSASIGYWNIDTLPGGPALLDSGSAFSDRESASPQRVCLGLERTLAAAPRAATRATTGAATRIATRVATRAAGSSVVWPPIFGSRSPVSAASVP